MWRKLTLLLMDAWVAWCEQQQLVWDARLDIVHVHGDVADELLSEPGSYAVVANAPIQAGDVLARVPCTALLCQRNCALKMPMRSGPPSLYLALCVVYEIALGEGSTFAPYLAMMPRVALPLTWDAESVESLCMRGTEAERIMHRQMCAFQCGYKYIGTSYVRLCTNTGGVAIILVPGREASARRGWHACTIQCICARIFTCVQSCICN